MLRLFDENLVAQITIEKQNSGIEININAKIYLSDGKVKNIAIGNVENFIEKIEKYQINEKVR